MIDLPQGGAFDEDLLIAHLRGMGRNSIVQAQQNQSLADHTKPRSLDYWLRTNGAENPDTKQAENDVIAALVRTGMFVVDDNILCPDSGQLCKGLRLLDR